MEMRLKSQKRLFAAGAKSNAIGKTQKRKIHQLSLTIIEIPDKLKDKQIKSKISRQKTSR
jgi:hypothetical protein